MIRTAANDRISIVRAGQQVWMTITAKGKHNITIKLWPDEAARIGKELAIAAQKRNYGEKGHTGVDLGFCGEIQ